MREGGKGGEKEQVRQEMDPNSHNGNTSRDLLQNTLLVPGFF